MQLISPAPLPETQHISVNNLNNPRVCLSLRPELSRFPGRITCTLSELRPLFGAYCELMFKMVEEAGIEAEQVTQAILFFAFYCALMHALPNG